MFLHSSAALKSTLLLVFLRSLAEWSLAERKVVRLVTGPYFLRELRTGYEPPLPSTR